MGIINTTLRGDDEIPDESQNPTNKISTAVKILQNWKDGNSHVFLKHPGILYHMDNIKDHRESVEGCKRNLTLSKLSPQECLSYVRNIHLDIVNMVIDHLPISYNNTLHTL